MGVFGDNPNYVSDDIAGDKKCPVEHVMEIYWEGTEDEQDYARLKACQARRAQYEDDDCDLDGSCDECYYDMCEALRVTHTQCSK